MQELGGKQEQEQDLQNSFKNSFLGRYARMTAAHHEAVLESLHGSLGPPDKYHAVAAPLVQ